MIYENKYDIMPVHALVKGAQEMHLKMDALRKNKKGSLRSTIKMGQELNSIRSAAQKKLSGMDRTKSSFFPVGVLVEYEHTYHPGQKRNGTVVAHDGDDICLVQFEGDEFQVRVWPGYLTLRFIRTIYY